MSLNIMIISLAGIVGIICIMRMTVLYDEENEEHFYAYLIALIWIFVSVMQAFQIMILQDV